MMFIDNNNRILCQDFELATPVKSASLLTGGPGETKVRVFGDGPSQLTGIKLEKVKKVSYLGSISRFSRPKNEL